MLRARKSFSIMVVLALVLSLGALVVPVGGVAANPSHIDVYSGESIQDAIDDADPGDIITVHPGTYGEDLAIDKSLTLQSSGGADETTIEGNVDIDLEDEEEALFGGAGAGFKVTNSSGDGIDARVYYWSSLTIEDNIITGNDCGIDIDGYVDYFSTLNVLNNEITDNDFDGIYIDCIYYHSDCLIEGNTISVNDYGIYLSQYVYYGSSLSIVDNVITDNDSDGIWIYPIDYGSDCLIAGNTISGNNYGIDIDGYVDYGSTLSILDNTITGNVNDGIWIYYIDYGSDCLIEGNAISDNNYGIWVDEVVDYGSTLSILDNLITDNDSDGIYIYQIDDGSDCLIEGNTISGNDYGIDIDEYVDYGSTLYILDNTITDNDSDGIYIGNDIDDGSDCLIEGNTISGNDYGIYFYYYVDYGSTLSILDNVITDNDSAGIYFNDYIGYGAEVLIEVNAISANGGSGIYLFDISDSTVNILENVICRNADEGIYLYVSHSMVTVEDNDILANYDGIYANGSDLYLTGIHQNDIEQNSDYGIYNDSGETLDAESNWWNDASGPSGAGPGEGDAVSANVLYDPWLTSAITVMHAAFSASPDSGTAPMKVQFSNQSQGPTRDWLWSFGDGVTSTEQSPSHTYDSHGTYTVTLEVSDACVSDTASATITVSKPQLQSEPNPASFYTCYLYITPQQVLPNQQVEISVNACNKGEERGSYTASLYINGILEDSQTVGVSGDSCQGAVFRVSKSQPGTYQVIVDGQEGYFTVVATSQQTSSSFGGGLGTGGIVVVALVIVALVLAIVLVFARMRRE